MEACTNCPFNCYHAPESYGLKSTLYNYMGLIAIEEENKIYLLEGETNERMTKNDFSPPLTMTEKAQDPQTVEIDFSLGAFCFPNEKTAIFARMKDTIRS